MTTTLSNMIDEVVTNLSGYTYQQERTTYLRSSVTTTVSSSASPTILALGSTENVGKGVVEIGEELMWIDTFDRVGNTASVSPYGRGYLGTTASQHNADSKVTISPIFPRSSIKRAIDDTIRAAGSMLFAVKSTSFTYNAAETTYAFNDLNISNILRQTGLPESCKDVIILGASYRLLTYLDPARAAQVSPQADETDSKRPYGASQSATKQLYALYTQRLQEETQRQQNQYPIRVHYSR